MQRRQLWEDLNVVLSHICSRLSLKGGCEAETDVSYHALSVL